jgi:hypothetical protein
MNEMTFNSMVEFFNHIHSRGGANIPTHGVLGSFYIMMSVYTNPNTCSCKKGKAAYNNIFNTCKSLSTSLSGEQLMNSRGMFDDKIVVVKEGGNEIVRF